MTGTNGAKAGLAKFGHTEGRLHAPGFGRAGAVVGVLSVVGLFAGLGWSAANGQEVTSTSPQLFNQTVMLNDSAMPTLVSMPNATALLDVAGLQEAVGAPNAAHVLTYNAAPGTWIVNSQTGAFNLLSSASSIEGPTTGGLRLPAYPSGQAAAAFPTGNSLFIVQTGHGKGEVSLVSSDVVSASSGAVNASVTGQAPLPVAISTSPGQVAVTGTSLYALAGGSGSCQLLEVSMGQRGLATHRVAVNLPNSCDQAGLTTVGSTLAVITPGAVTYLKGNRSARASFKQDSSYGDYLPVQNTGAAATWMARNAQGWATIVADPFGRGKQAKPVLTPINGIPAKTSLVQPAYSDARIYTMAQESGTAPAPMWEISGNRAGPIGHLSTYPVSQKEHQEGVAWGAGQIIASSSGPRVVLNDPNHMQAVMVITSGKTPKAETIDKRSAPQITGSGQAVVSGTRKQPSAIRTQTRTPKPTTGKTNHPGSRKQSTPPTTTKVHNAPTAQPNGVTPDDTCTDTTETPAPPDDVNAGTPSSTSALVSWDYVEQQGMCNPSWFIVRWSTNARFHGGSSIKVQGTPSGQYLLRGLKPHTQYWVQVVATLPHHTTAAAPVTFTTTIGQIPSPSAVNVTMDNQGNWHYTIIGCKGSSCGTQPQRYQVKPLVCSSWESGSNPSLPLQYVPASQPSGVYPTNKSLLGMGLKFEVVGMYNANTSDPAESTNCLVSYQRPAGLKLALSGSGRQVTAQLSPSISTDLAAYGGPDPDFAYRLWTGGKPYNSAWRTIQPTQGLNPTLNPGDTLDYNTTYRMEVKVWPSGHQNVASTFWSGPATTGKEPWPTNITFTPAAPLIGTTLNQQSQAQVQLSVVNAPDFPLRTTGTYTCNNRSRTFHGVAQPGQAIDLTKVLLSQATSPYCDVSGIRVYWTGKGRNPYGPGGESIPGTFKADLPQLSPPAPTYSFAQTLPCSQGDTNTGGNICRDTVTINLDAGFVGKYQTITVAPDNGNACFVSQGGVLGLGAQWVTAPNPTVDAAATDPWGQQPSISVLAHMCNYQNPNNLYNSFDVGVTAVQYGATLGPVQAAWGNSTGVSTTPPTSPPSSTPDTSNPPPSSTPDTSDSPPSSTPDSTGGSAKLDSDLLTHLAAESPTVTTGPSAGTLVADGIFGGASAAVLGLLLVSLNRRRRRQ